MEEEKAPYFAVRVRSGDITSPKDLVGMKDFTIEITMGNQDTIKISNPDDVADITQKGIFDVAREIYKQRDEFGKEMGFTYLDQVDAQALLGFGKASKK